jgi:hypothetical protein
MFCYAATASILITVAGYHGFLSVNKKLPALKALPSKAFK